MLLARLATGAHAARHGLRRLSQFGLRLLLAAAVLSACDIRVQSHAETDRASVPVDAATETLLPTHTPSPTHTPMPTATPIPLPKQGFVEITSGSFHSCALRHDGVAVCWGQDRYGQASPPDGERFTSISAGDRHACALREDGSKVCWGVVPFGGEIVMRKSREATVRSWGAHHACELREGGRPRCWMCAA